MKKISFFDFFVIDWIKRQRTGGVFSIFDRKMIFFLFDSFEIEGLKSFIIQNDRRIIDKIISGIENMEMVDDKLMLEKLKLSIKAFNKLSNEDIKRFRETAFIESFGKLNNLHNCVGLWLLEDPIQKAETSTYRPFQIYF